MNIVLPKKGDIIIRKSNDELPTVWISQRYLLTLLAPIGLTETYLSCKARAQYKKSVAPSFQNRSFLPDTYKSWRYSKQDGMFFYSYDNIPNKAPQFYQSNLPSKKQLVELAENTLDVARETEIESFIKEYVNTNYKSFFQFYNEYNKAQRQACSLAACFIAAAGFYIKSRTGGICDKDLFQKLTYLREETGATYLPKHPRNISALVRAHIEGKEPFELVKLKRANNSNALVHAADAELESWMYFMRKSGHNYTNAHIARKLKFLCTISDKKEPSERWITTQMSKPITEFLTAGERYGATGKHGVRYRDSIPLKNAVYAGDCWQIDGTRVNFLPFKLNGKEVFLYIVAVRDVHSGDVLGYSFDLSENRWTVINALKMAAEETGYLPYQMIFDRFPGHNTPEFKTIVDEMEQRGVEVSFVHKSSGKPQLERWFRTLQEVFMQDSDYYYGEGIMSRNRYAHRSKETIKQLRKLSKEQGYNYDAAVAEACKVIETYRSTKLSYYSKKYKSIEHSPAELHEMSEKPNVRPLEAHQVQYLFGLKKKLQLRNNGIITTTIQGVDFSYRLANIDAVANCREVLIVYNLEDINQVHCYEVTDRPLKKYYGIAEEVGVQMYGPDAEWKKLQQQQAIIAEINQWKEEQLNMKMAVGYDVATLLQGGQVQKYDYESTDAAATVHLMGMNETDTGIDDYDARNSY